MHPYELLVTDPSMPVSSCALQHMRWPMVEIEAHACGDWLALKDSNFVLSRVPCLAGHPSLASARPDLVKQLHPSKNPGIDPNKITLGSSKPATWLCQCPSCGADHVWTVKVAHRALWGTACPYCSGQKACKCNSLAAVNPQLSVEWDAARNGALQPSDVLPFSTRKVWWHCCHHGAWQALIYNRHAGKGCPKCSHSKGKSQIKTRSQRKLSEESPLLRQEWHPTLNGDTSPEELLTGSNKKVWWLCKQSACHHPHEWQNTVWNRSGLGAGCPFCSSNRICPCNSLQGKQPDVAAQWHPTKNGDLLPEHCGPGSPLKVWWLCPASTCQHAHEWQASPKDRTRSKGRGCPFCSGRQCCACNSFQPRYPVLAAQWHSTRNGGLSPDQYAVFSAERVWWQHQADDGEVHEWQSSILARKAKGSRCPKCFPQRCVSLPLIGQ